MTCRACGSSRTVYDRTLAGREVCLDCGAAQGSRPPRRRSRTTRPRSLRPLLGLVGVGAALLAWVSPLPFSLRPGDRLLQRNTPPDPNDPLIVALAHQPLARVLMDAGVQIVVGRGLPPGSRHCRYACWLPQTGTLYLNRLTNRGDAASLRHEATHVAQSCRNWGLRTEAVPLGLPLTGADRRRFQAVADFYRRKGDRDVTTELEAYHVQFRTSTATTIALVRRECDRLPYLNASVLARNLIQNLSRTAIRSLILPATTPKKQ